MGSERSYSVEDGSSALGDAASARSWKELAEVASATEVQKELVRWSSGTNSFKQQRRWQAADAVVDKIAQQLSSASLLHIETSTNENSTDETMQTGAAAPKPKARMPRLRNHISAFA